MRKPRMTAAPGGGDYHVASSSLGMASLDVSEELVYVPIRELFDNGSLHV